MIKIIFEDNHLIGVDKPPGLLVVPTPRGEKRTLKHLLPKILKKRGYEGKVYPCHRIDRETSGIVLFAKDKETEEAMFNLFKQRKIRKIYIAVVKGDLRPKESVIKNRIEGVGAITKYRVLKRYRIYTFVEVQPITGRTNQIRIHFKQIGHPILGDRKFARGKDFPVKFRRVALHAKELSFIHPKTRKLIYLKTALPSDIKALLVNCTF